MALNYCKYCGISFPCLNFIAMIFATYFFGLGAWRSCFVRYYGKSLFVILSCLLAHSISIAQSAEVKFGQNRVQYKDFAFQYYESDHFITYFYPGGQDIAKYVIKTAEDNVKPISDFLNYRSRRKIDIIIYNTINELNQTNIGIYAPPANQGTTVDLVNGKIFIYFNGDHGHLDRQIKQGIVRNYIDRQNSGTGINELVSNVKTIGQPDWYVKGLVSYLTENWNADMEDHLRDGINTGRYKELNKLSPEEATFVGHSVFHYVEEVYGISTVSNLQYLCRINRSVDNGFYFALGTNLNETLQGWYTYYSNRFNNELRSTTPRESQNFIKKKTRPETSYYQSRVSPDGRFVAYASNNMGRYKVHLVDLEKKKKKVVHKGGWRTRTQWSDGSIPLIAWGPKSDKLGFIFDKRSIVRLGEYTVTKEKGKPRKEFRRIEKFPKVTSFTYADSKTLAFAAIRNGQSDIFLYTIPSQTVRQITNDFYDDFTPAVVTIDSVRGVVFASNRPDDTIRKEKYESQEFDKQTDLFFYDLDNGGNALYRITNTPNANESQPQQFNDHYFSFLSEGSGIRNQYLAKLQTKFDHHDKKYHFVSRESHEEDSLSLAEGIDYHLVLDTAAVDIMSVTQGDVFRTSGKVYQFSNFTSNIIEQSLCTSKGFALDHVKHKGRDQFYKYDISTSNPNPAIVYPQTDYMKRRNNIMLSEDSLKKAEQEKKQAEYDLRNDHGQKVYTAQDFQSEYDYGVRLFDWDSLASANKSGSISSGYVFRFAKVRPYFVRFMVDNFAAQIDNDLLITKYQTFNPQNPGYMFQPLNALFKIGITDLLEDYKIYGGLTLPVGGASGFSFSDLGYFLVYENLKKRWDKKVTFYYQSLSSSATSKVPFYNTIIPENIGQVNYGVKTTYLETQFKYPFDAFHRVMLGAGYRNDRYIFKSQDTFSLAIPTYSTNWIFLKSEYVFDNTIDVMTDIKYGFRAKAFFEFHKEIPTQLVGGVHLPDWNNNYFTEIGFDARYYLKIYKQMILASRLSFATSLGNDKMIHYLGGLDNDILTSLKTTTNTDMQAPINNNLHYVYQTMGSPMRGFTPNSRNGTSFLLANAELRIPIVTLLMKRPPKSEFMRNFMVVGFLDCGTAWEGVSPFVNNRLLFKTSYPNSVSVVTLEQYKTPVILGTGFGLRTSLLGYFVKLDMAWGLDTGIWSAKPLYYLSLGHDF